MRELQRNAKKNNVFLIHFIRFEMHMDRAADKSENILGIWYYLTKHLTFYASSFFTRKASICRCVYNWSDTHFDVKNLILFNKLGFNEIFFFLFLASGASESRGGASGAGANNAVNKYDKLVAAPDESAEHETSPNLSKHRTQGKEKRIPTKMHHANRGKQQKDRRKLREKRRSTGKTQVYSKIR